MTVAAGPRAVAVGADIQVSRGSLELVVDLRVEPGQRCLLVGPNGAGKSTVLRVLAGLINPVAGRIEIGGVAVAGAGVRPVRPHRRPVGYLPQGGGVFPHLTAAQNVAYPLHARRLARREVRRQAEEIITAFGIAGIVGLSGGHLSGGQAARVGLARALAAARGLVLLDEPFAALDPAAARDLRGRLSEWLDRTRQTCLMVSHEARDQVGDWDLTVELGSGRPRIAVL